MIYNPYEFRVFKVQIDNIFLRHLKYKRLYFPFFGVAFDVMKVQNFGPEHMSYRPQITFLGVGIKLCINIKTSNQ